MKKIIVIGGGLSGLTAAYYLSKKNYQITLIEASPKLGGRTYSLINPKFDDTFDNGQHLMMGCYNATLNLINELGSKDKIEIQKKLSVVFVDENSKQFKLEAVTNFYPFNLLLAILKYKALSLKDRMKVIDFILDIACCFKEDLENLTVLEWLLLKNQNDETINKLWEILVVGTMNCSPEKASALIFSNVLREIFLNGNSSAKIVLTKTGLSQIFVDPIKEILHKNNNEIKTSEKLENIFIEKNKVKKISTNKNDYENFDDIILAIPPHAISKLNFIDENGKIFSPLSKILADDFKYSSILNIHLWLSENIFQENFYGLLNSEIHWIFNHGKHISITKSNSDLISDMNEDQILEIVYSEFKNYFPIFSVEKVVDVKIIKEKRATFVPDVASNVLRKKIISEFDNLHFIGDWTTKEFPSTIEGAILSGKNIIDSI